MNMLFFCVCVYDNIAARQFRMRSSQSLQHWENFMYEEEKISSGTVKTAVSGPRLKGW